MAAQLFRIGKPKNGQRQLEEKVRFELDNAEREGEGGQMEEDGERPMHLGSVQERFAGFFELPERCVPFETAPFAEEISKQGFPTVIELTEHTKPISDSINVPKTGRRQKVKSLFAQHFDQTKQREQKNDPQAKVTDGIVDQSIQNLELMSAPSFGHHSQSIRTEHDQSGRYALDPVRSDFVVKCLRHVVSRQEQQLVKLFDTLSSTNLSHNSFSPQLSPEKVHILEEAKRSIESIRPLYLEQILSEENGRVKWHFARRFVDPFSSGAWTLSPIRRVLDAVQQRNSAVATPDDVEMVRLALLWTVLLSLQRPVLFRASVSISEFFCRMAEIYLIGPEVFLYDQQIHCCISILVDNFLINACQNGLMALRLHAPIASLDRFMPFYEDLLQHYESFSADDDNFALLLLIGAYLNCSRLDGLLMAQTLWSPKRDVVRQMILTEGKAELFIPFVFANDRSVEDDERENKLINEGIAKLVANCVFALEKGTVTRERNGAMYAIAMAEIKQFIGKTVGGNEAPNDEPPKGLQETPSKFTA